MTPRPPVVVRFVPAPAQRSMRPALELLAKAAGHESFAALRAQAISEANATAGSKA